MLVANVYVPISFGAVMVELGVTCSVVRRVMMVPVREGTPRGGLPFNLKHTLVSFKPKQAWEPTPSSLSSSQAKTQTHQTIAMPRRFEANHPPQSSR
jgi:hypothetical protein